MLELEGDYYGHGFLYYCLSNNGVIEEFFFLRTGFRAILVTLGIDVWGSLADCDDRQTPPFDR